MKKVSVRDIYTVDTISKGNFKAWLKLMDFMTKEVKADEEVEFDFKGIEVIQPWATNEFKQFMQDNRVHLQLWDSEGTVNSINLMCKLNGMTSDRAVNKKVEVKRELTKEERQIIEKANDLQKYFEQDPANTEKAILHIHKRFDQIGVPITVKYIEAAMLKYAAEHNCKAILIDAKGIAILPSIIKDLTSLISKMNNSGISLTINSDDGEVMNKMGMYKSLEGNEIVNEKDKVRLIKAMLHQGKVGMLIKYKESKAVDEFGRSGKGKPVSCRVAIYNGMKREREGIKLKFTTFNGNTFYTHIHWSLEHDNDELHKLDTEEVSIPIDQFGMYNDFLGSRYHLITPVQLHAEDCITMYGVDSGGKVTYTRMTIPERIKAVFDDWGVSYDTESLQSYIQKTREIVG